MFDVEAVFIFRGRSASRAWGRSRWSRWSSSWILALGLVYAWRKGASVGLVNAAWCPSRSRAAQLQPQVLAVDVPVGLACCAIEMGARSPVPLRHDAPRRHPVPGQSAQADLVVISGTVTDKMAPAISASTSSARSQVRDLDGGVPAAAARTGTRTRSPRASTRSSPSTCTCRAARRARGAAPGHRPAPGAHPAGGHRERRAQGPLDGSRSSLADDLERGRRAPPRR